jgi:hypothetical protein
MTVPAAQTLAAAAVTGTTASAGGTGRTQTANSPSAAPAKALPQCLPTARRY